MFEPQKLITVAFALILLAPFGCVFWQIVVHQPRPGVEVRAELLAMLRKPKHLVDIPLVGDDFKEKAGALRQVETIALSESTASWLSFYPHRWAGVLGLIGIAFVMVALLASLFLIGGVTVSTRDLASHPTTNAQR